jgi:hypothetical protein
VRPFAFLVFDRAGLSTLARASGRRLQIDTCCLSGEPVRGAFAHVGTLSDSDAALRFDEHEVQQARRDVLASWIPLLGADLCASPPAPLMPAGTGRDHRGAAPGSLRGRSVRPPLPGHAHGDRPLRRGSAAARPRNRALRRPAVAGRRVLNPLLDARSRCPGELRPHRGAAPLDPDARRPRAIRWSILRGGLRRGSPCSDSRRRSPPLLFLREMRASPSAASRRSLRTTSERAD